MGRKQFVWLTFAATSYLSPYPPHVRSFEPGKRKEAALFTVYAGPLDLPMAEAQLYFNTL